MYYCDFEDTNKIFNHKKIYRCRYCHTTLALENPNAHIICFKRQNDFLDQLDNANREPNDQIISQHLDSAAQTEAAVKQDFLSKAIQMPTDLNADRPDNLCSKEEIDYRMSICQQCEHYRNDACMLCGCTIIREKNFNNKLAHKDKSCPINRWGPITSSKNN